MYSPDNKNTIYLIDSMAYFFRGYHAISDFYSPLGFKVGALWGLASAIQRIKACHPHYVAVCLDAGRSNRNAILPEYKAHRGARSDDFKEQAEWIESLCYSLGVVCIKSPGYEADDVMASVARLATTHGMLVRVLTQDKDMCQIVNQSVHILRLLKEDKKNYIKLITPEEVVNWLGVPPHLVVDYLSLVGDAVDNVPGAPGIGSRGAIKLLEQFGSLDNIYKNLSEISSIKYRTALADNKRAVYISRAVVTVLEQIPLDIKSIEDFQVFTPDTEYAYEVLTDLGFNGMAADLAKNMYAKNL